MSDPLLYYTPGTCSMSELICLEWIGRPYRLCRVEREQRQSPAYLAINPHGSVPAMEVGGRILVENSALLNHLADRHPEAELLPPVASDARDEAQFWLSYIGTRYHVAHYPVFKPQRYSDRDDLHEHLREVAVEQVGKELAFVDEKLAGRDFAVGGARSVGDAYFVATGRWARRFFEYEDTCPEFDRYLKRWDADPGVQRAKQIEAGEIEGPDGPLVGHVPLT